MSITKGIAALVLVIAFFVALIHQFMPRAVRTPTGAMHAVIARADRAVWQRAGVAYDVDSERKLRLTENGSAVSAPNQGGSQLVTLIAGKGLSCDRVTGVVPVRAGDGIYAITCQVGAGYQRYVVDTRKGDVLTG